MLSHHCLCSQHVDGWDLHCHGFNPHICFLPPFSEKDCPSHPSGVHLSYFSWETAPGNLCCKGWRGLNACRTLGSKPSPSHVPALSFPCFSQRCFCFMFLFVALSSNEIMKKKPPHPKPSSQTTLGFISCWGTILGAALGANTDLLRQHPAGRALTPAAPPQRSLLQLWCLHP